MAVNWLGQFTLNVNVGQVKRVNGIELGGWIGSGLTCGTGRNDGFNINSIELSNDSSNVGPNPSKRKGPGAARRFLPIKNEMIKMFLF